MKKTYETPSVEKIAFRYKDQVVAASYPVNLCIQGWIKDSNENTSGCEYTVHKADSGYYGLR